MVSAAVQPLAIPNPFSVGSGQVIKWIVEGITKAINAFFGQLVKDALNPLLKLLGQTLLTTPDPSSLPRVGQLWENSREIAVAVYTLIILAAGVLVMAYETLQTRTSIKEIAPRVVVGFITANMSLLLAGKAVAFANALSTGLLGQGMDAKSAASTLTSLVMNAVTNGGIFLIFIGIGLAVILVALLVTYVIRVALTVILIAGAPLALMCHALPQTEGIARWWWRAFAGVLAIQLCQSLTLVAAMNVFLTKGGFSFFGPTSDGLVNVIVTLALLYILYKIPFWILHSVQVGGGRSFLGGIVKGLIAYKTLGLLGLRGGATGAPRHGGGPGRPGNPGGPGGRGGPGGSGPAGGGPRRRPRPGGPAPSGSRRPRQPRPAGPMAGAARARSTPASPALPSVISAASDLPVASRTPADDHPQTPPGRMRPSTPLHEPRPLHVPERVRLTAAPSRTRAPHRPVPVTRPTGLALVPVVRPAPPTTAAQAPTTPAPTPTALAATAKDRPPLDLARRPPRAPRAHPTAPPRVPPRRVPPPPRRRPQHPPRGGETR